MTHAYEITYTVEAGSRLDAIAKATRMLLRRPASMAVVDARETRPGWWYVRLHVREDS